MTKPLRIALFIAVPLFILLLPIAVYVVDVSANEGTIARNVSIAGIDVSGMSAEEAAVAVGVYEERLEEPAAFVVNGQNYELDPVAAGLQINTDAAIAQALQQGQGGLIAGFGPWIGSFGETIAVELEVSIEGDVISRRLVEWETDAVAEPAFEGSVNVVAGKVEHEYPRDGLALDRETSADIVEATLLSVERKPEELPLLDIKSELTKADIDEAVETVEQLISDAVELRNEEYELTFVMEPAEMAAAVRTEVVTESPAHVEITLDEDVVDSYLEPKRPELETEPTEVVIDTNIATNGVTVTPGKAGTAVDAAEVAPALYRAALAERTGHLPVGEGKQPEWTEEEIEAWGPLGRVSDFTTKHPAGQPRVTNIQLMAKTVDETIVWPGEVFSINDIVGQRTERKGYLADGAIINGEVQCCDDPANIGGGVSQFGTTMYNAIFFGCYEEIEHAPHSIYFSKYPEGREATLGFPHPDVSFRNDSDAPVIVRTGYSATSITVKLFGNNGGRKCSSERSERFNPTEPRVVYEANPRLSPGTEKLVRRGTDGWSVTITKVITYPDGTVEREKYTHRYHGSARVYQVPSCSAAPGSARCTNIPEDELPPPTTAPPATTAPTETTVPPTDTTVPPVTEPPVTEPPVTEPPVTEDPGDGDG